jgi:hypothetical protein
VHQNIGISALFAFSLIAYWNPNSRAVLAGAIEPSFQPSGGTLQIFTPLKIEAPNFYDGTPPNSFDLTLINPETDSVVGVGIPSPGTCTVVEAKYSEEGYGNRVDLDCEGKGIFMAHLAELWVKPGDRVSPGQVIGVQGSTGRSTGEHVHIEIDLDGDDNADPYAQSEPVMQQMMDFWQGKGGSFE